MSLSDSWNSDSRFGGGPVSAQAATMAPGLPSPASSTSAVQPATSALHAIVDPRGSAIFWILAASILGLLMVQGQLSIAGKLKTRAGK